MAKENDVTAGQQPQTDRSAEELAEESGNARLPRWREILRQAVNQRNNEHPVTSRRELGRDRTRTLFLLVIAIVAILLFFLVVFSSPNKNRRPDRMGRPNTPELGRRVTPGEQAAQTDSATPLLNAETSSHDNQDPDGVTAEEVGRTARPTHAPNTPVQKTPATRGGPYSLGQIDFSDSTAPQPERVHAPETEGLRKPSLVFARSSQDLTINSEGKFAPSVLKPNIATIDLPAGTRLVARLQSVVSSVVKTPIVAAIEYNYERDGEIAIPAGTKAFGSLEQADRSGYVAIRFDMLEMPDGTTEKIDATAMSLAYGPIKGDVSGKRTGTRFLVRAFTGLGTVATYLVGAGGSSGFNGPLSESALLRDRIANNVGIAGDQELNGLAFNQNIIVTVPANTRFYVVIDKGLINAEPATRQTNVQSNTVLPTAEDLRQLMQLRREMSELYRQGAASNASQPVPQP